MTEKGFQKGNKLRKGKPPVNKIIDIYTDMKISRQMRHYLRKRDKQKEQDDKVQP